MFYLCGAMVTLLILFGACTTPAQEVVISPTPDEPASEITTPAPTRTPDPTSTPIQAPTATPTSILSKEATPTSSPTPAVIAGEPEEAEEKIYANVTHIIAKGSSRGYAFSVTVRSPDTGCTQYADWWEVLNEDGDLIYRRVLAHSHTEEQPFTRSGSPVEVQPTQTVIVRAHMNTSGYGDVALKGSVEGGFSQISLDMGFASKAETQEPLPDSCAF